MVPNDNHDDSIYVPPNNQSVFYPAGTFWKNNKFVNNKRIFNGLNKYLFYKTCSKYFIKDFFISFFIKQVQFKFNRHV